MKQFAIGRVGLALLATAVVCLSQAAVASAGGNSGAAKVCQKGGWQTLIVLVQDNFTQPTSEEQCVSDAAAGDSALGATSAITPSTLTGGNLWGGVSGFGLQPGSRVNLYATSPYGIGIQGSATVGPDGTVGPILGLWPCGQGWVSFAAFGTTSGGVQIGSQTLSSPCG